MRKIVFVITLAAMSGYAFSQQLPIYSQYLLNSFMINPAIAGSDGYTSVNVTSRKQWIGLSGAPEVYSASFQTRLLKREYVLKTRRNRKKLFRPSTDGKVGLGGHIYDYQSGLIRRTGFQFSYVYHTWIQRRTQLSFSIGLTGYHFRIKEKEIKFENPQDPVLGDYLRRGLFVPDVVVGAYLRDERYTLGFSADQLLGSFARVGSRRFSNYDMKRHFYLMGSYSFFLSAESEIRPSFLLKTSEELKPQADLGVTYFFDNFKNAYWAGISFRTNSAIISYIGIRADNIFLGYAFDFSLNDIQKLTYGTHEISAAFMFGSYQKRYRWRNRY